jgi:hypothetical protein
MMEPIKELDKRGLRSFGLQFAALIAFFFGGLIPWLLNFKYPLWPWIVAALLGGWALAAPGSLRLLYIGWMRLGLLLNRVTSPILMGLVYFTVFTPVAVCLKILRRDLLHRSLDEDATTYRVDAAEDDIESELKNPY